MPSNQNSKFIRIKGARVNNLKNVSIDIPRDKLVVITGLSGSGKSSLAFDTLYAEGQRRYVESLSTYARQFLGRINKPEVDFIEGIPPAIAIEQKVNSTNPRSTVGTSTEIYDYLKLLFARIGKTYSPISGNIVKRHTVTDVVDFIYSFSAKTTLFIESPIVQTHGKDLRKQLEVLQQQGFSRVDVNNEVVLITDFLTKEPTSKNVFLIVDRVQVVKNDDDFNSRIADSIQTAFYEGHGICFVKVFSKDNQQERIEFSNKFEADGIEFEEPTVNVFSFNNPVGACKTCEGFGKILGIDEDLVIPNKSLSVYNEAIVCWKGEKLGLWRKRLIDNAQKFDFPIHRPYSQLNDYQKKLLWTGNKYFEGIDEFFKMLENENYKIQNRVMLARYRGKKTCPDCLGTRLKKEASYVKVDKKSIHEFVLMPVNQLHNFFVNLKLDAHSQKVASRLLLEIKNRLGFLVNVGLGYLSLNRLSSTLSGGESQRINLATSLGSSLVGSLYILDEPSIGLHSRDTQLLIKVLRHLQKIGNTVVVVEHDEEIIMSADEIIDIGPFAGSLGGEICFQGVHKDLLNVENSLTAKYLTGREKIEIPKFRKNWNSFIEVKGAAENNLKNIDVKFPLHILTVVTGVSGSGKSSLVKNILYSALKKYFGGVAEKTGRYDELSGDIKMIQNVEMVDQNPIGRSSRSNPVTYIKAYEDIRYLFAQQKLSTHNGYKASDFSFNLEGGRCEECQGDGVIKVEMQFMADVSLICESCHGKRFRDDILEVKYNGKNIFDILEMTVNDAIIFFENSEDNLSKKIARKLQPLADVGLDYVKLGQASSTLSGGESQRIKLAVFLSVEKSGIPTMFIFDEPTTGLHFNDIKKLLNALNALVKQGHTVLIIEHNLEIIKSCDWIIDLGPEGGENGGNIVFEGTPENIIKCSNSFTGKALKPKLNFE